MNGQRNATGLIASPFCSRLGGGAVGCVEFFSYERHPHIPDEVVYIYHARYLAGGMLTMTMPPVPEAFEVNLMNYENNAWFCPVPPGWPAVLALGVLFGASWLINPLLAGLNVLLAYSLLRQLYNRDTARIATLCYARRVVHLYGYNS